MLTSWRGIVLFLMSVCLFYSQMAAAQPCEKYMYRDTFLSTCKPCYVCYPQIVVQKEADCPTLVKCAMGASGVFIGCPELEYKTEDKPVECRGYSLENKRILNGTCHVVCNETDGVNLRCQLTLDKGVYAGQWQPAPPSCVRHIPTLPDKAVVESVTGKRVTDTRRQINTTAQNSPLPSKKVQSDEELSILPIVVPIGIITSIFVSVTVIVWRKRMGDHTQGLEAEDPPGGKGNREAVEHEEENLPLTELNQENIVLPNVNSSLSSPLSEPSEERDSLSSLGTLGTVSQEGGDEMDVTQPKRRISEPVQAEWSCESCSSLSSPGSTLLYPMGDSSTSGVESGTSLTSSGGAVESRENAVSYPVVNYHSCVSNVLPSNAIHTFAQHPIRYRTPTQHPKDIHFVGNPTPQENEDEDSFLQADVPSSHFHDIDMHTIDQIMADQYHSNTQAFEQHFPDRTLDGTAVVPTEHSCYSQGNIRPDSGPLISYSLTRPHRGTNMATEHTCHSSSPSHLNSINDN